MLSWWLIYSVLNSIRNFISGRKSDIIVILLGGPIVCGWGVGLAFDELREAKPYTATHWTATFSGIEVLVVFVGLTAGSLSFLLMNNRVSSTWLSVLPLSRPEKIRSALNLSWLCGLFQTLIVSIVTALAVGVLHPGKQGEEITFIVLTFVIGFVLGIIAGLTRTTIISTLSPFRSHVMSPSWVTKQRAGGKNAKAVFRSLFLFDRLRPKWLWTWTLEDSWASKMLILLAVFSLGASGCVRGILTRSPLIVAFSSLVASHLIFLILVRLAPMSSPVLRTQPISYFRVLLALVRSPLLLSLIVCTTLVSVAVLFGIPGRAIMAESILVLVALNILHSFFYSAMPKNKRTSILIYFFFMSATVYQYGQMNTAVFPLLLGFALIFLVRGRVNFYRYG